LVHEEGAVMFKTQYAMAIVALLGFSSSTYARKHHHHHGSDERVIIYEDGTPRAYEYEYESTVPPLRGQPISPEEAERIEADDARAGEEADRAADAERNRQAKAGRITRYPNIEIKNLSRDGDIWVGGEPTLRGYRQLHDRGVDAVVDLRNRGSGQRASAREAAKLGMDYISLPISPKSMSPGDADAFLRFMDKHRGDQVLIHCGSANRASGMYAIYLGMAKGYSPEDAIRRARQTGLKEASLESDARNYLESHRAAPVRESANIDKNR
jgi:protein tyrosine phosphatase (PTP) superfamily phosphohydrolase (DUF442 family)